MVVAASVVPAFLKLHDYVVDTYIPATRDAISCYEFPNGKEHYAQCLRVHTSTNMTAQEIHDLGLRYVLLKFISPVSLMNANVNILLAFSVRWSEFIKKWIKLSLALALTVISMNSLPIYVQTRGIFIVSI